MPPSALDTLTRLNINYPMLFKLSNKRSNRQTHCGVLEFIADEEKIYIPYWVIIIFNIKIGIPNSSLTIPQVLIFFMKYIILLF